ncbi:MAG TPA: nucleoside deaminase [Sphingobium sp.]|nr:nucleoside deaminase [Sphingobium sp.]
MSPFPLPLPMRRALDLAREAALAGEVPIGAVITREGRIVAEGQNRNRRDSDPTAHAEIVAIRAAAAAIGDFRLVGHALWVTLEPCAMCAGAISHARLDAVYYGASDPKGGGIDHGARVFAHPQCHHRPEVYPGMGEGEAAEMLRAFFAGRRS